MYRGLLRTKRITSLLYSVGSRGGGDSEGVLPAITVLKKLCNHPKLLATHTEEQEGDGTKQQQQASSKACSKTAELAASILQQHLPGAGAALDAVELSGAFETALPCLFDGIPCTAASPCTTACLSTPSQLAGCLLTWLSCCVLHPSGKLQTLSALLSGITAEGCKVVVVSTSTTALDMIDNLLCAPNK